jgi:hypothetical protein
MRSFIKEKTTLQLDRCIQYNEFQKAGKLPTENHEPGGNGTIIGWGRISPTAAVYPNTLQKASMKILSNSECSELLEINVHDEQICVFHREGIGSCYVRSYISLSSMIK